LLTEHSGRKLFSMWVVACEAQKSSLSYQRHALKLDQTPTLQMVSK